MNIFAIDPGMRNSKKSLGRLSDSSFVVYDPIEESIVEHGLNINNDVLLDKVRMLENHHYLVIEKVRSRGMIVGQEIFDLAEYVGALGEAYRYKNLVHKIFRDKVRIHMTGSPNSKDSNVRQAVIDRFGGQNIAVGGKRCPRCKGRGVVGAKKTDCADCVTTGWLISPGKLHGLKDDEWQALALALCFCDLKLAGKLGGVS